MFKARYAASLIFSLAVLAICAVDALGQSYPTRPIRLIVPFAPGGGVNFVGRLVGTRLSESLGQPLVIDARLGAGGVLGADIAAKAAPDGYTLLIGNNSTHGVNQVFNSKLPYDTIKDFTPVVNTADFKQKLKAQAAEPVGSTPEECVQSIKNEIAKWTKLAKQTGIHID